ncbi:MAG: tyrosine--tRNA ligase, partial [Oscillospiraceae bacterium]|nr:tyrosine--tRNA ligase [Oscillospiraceae bacterium]
ELTKLVHGEEEAGKAKTASHALFAGGSDDSNMPTTELSADVLTDGAINVMDLLVACKLTPSKSEARRLVQQGGVFVNDEKVGGIDASFTEAALREGLKIRKGKKVYHKAIIV